MTPMKKGEFGDSRGLSSPGISGGKVAGSKRRSATTRGLKDSSAGRAVQASDRSEDRIFAGVHHKSGRLATIREVLASDVPTRTGQDLSLGERSRLATRRIRDNDKFVSMMMLGVAGVIDKKRALMEIKEMSPIGLYLLDFDIRHSRLELEHSLAVRAKKRRKNGSGNDDRN
jgi:hypothetical protein